jgi:hypothetical protein
MALCEGIPEASRGSDVLLEEVAPDDQTYQYADDTIADGIGKEAWCYYQEED